MITTTMAPIVIHECKLAHIPYLEYKSSYSFYYIDFTLLFVQIKKLRGLETYYH
jgi:hypothetical protein